MNAAYSLQMTDPFFEVLGIKAHNIEMLRQECYTSLGLDWNPLNRITDYFLNSFIHNPIHISVILYYIYFELFLNKK